MARANGNTGGLKSSICFLNAKRESFAVLHSVRDDPGLTELTLMSGSHLKAWLLAKSSEMKDWPPRQPKAGYPE